ncbi:hypothetical protein cpbgf_7005710, partial [Cryptosporidium parvum]
SRDKLRPRSSGRHFSLKAYAQYKNLSMEDLE